MTLLNTGQYRDELVSVIRATDLHIDIVSAFITTSGLGMLLPHIKPGVTTRVLARWRLSDLTSGASDLEMYPLLRKRGIKFYVHHDVHAKAVLCDKRLILLGSANLTCRGLQLSNSDGNIEFGVRESAAAEDLVEIDRLFESAVELTDTLFDEIRAAVDACGSAPAPQQPEYSAKLTALLQPRKNGLWVRDLFWSSEPENLASGQLDSVHDMELLGIPPDEGRGPVDRARFHTLPSIVWIIQELAENGGELYFGSVTNKLHDVLLEDPKPYRKDVKTLAANLLTWCSFVLPETFQIDAPNFSQRIRLVADQPAESAEDYWLERILNLRQDHDPKTWTEGTLFASPHKPLFLLALLGTVFREGHRTRDFRLSAQLTLGFDSLWTVVSTGRGDPFLPFVHLSNDGLWIVFTNDGDKMTPMEARSLPQRDRQSIKGRIDDKLLSCLETAEFRTRLANAITRRYFDADTAALLRVRIVD